MDLEGWLETGGVLILMIGIYLVIRRPLQRKKLFDLASARHRRRQNEHLAEKLAHHSRR